MNKKNNQYLNDQVNSYKSEINAIKTNHRLMLRAIEQSDHANLPSDEQLILEQIQIGESIPSAAKDFFKESPMIGG